MNATLFDADNKLFALYEGLERLNAYLTVAVDLVVHRQLDEHDGRRLSTLVTIADQEVSDLLDALQKARTMIQEAQCRPSFKGENGVYRCDEDGRAGGAR